MRLAWVLLACSGCASAVWNARNLDCTGARTLYVDATEIELSTGEPDPGDDCTVALRGLRGSDIDLEDGVLELTDHREIELLMQRSRPHTEVLWRAGADIDVVLDDLSVQLDTRVGSRGRGTAVWQTDADPVEVRIETEDHLDQLQITTLGDVELELPPGSYRFEIDGGTPPLDASFVDELQGTLVLVRTPGEVTISPAGG